MEFWFFHFFQCLILEKFYLLVFFDNVDDSWVELWYVVCFILSFFGLLCELSEHSILCITVIGPAAHLKKESMQLVFKKYVQKLCHTMYAKLPKRWITVVVLSVEFCKWWGWWNDRYLPWLTGWWYIVFSVWEWFCSVCVISFFSIGFSLWCRGKLTERLNNKCNKNCIKQTDETLRILLFHNIFFNIYSCL